MTDAEYIIVKAFLAALSLMPEQSSLSAEGEVTVRSIAQSLDDRVIELHNLAIQSPALASTYQDARLYLVATAAERGMGINSLPDEVMDSDGLYESNNLTRDTKTDISKMKQVIQNIENELDIDKASKILSAPNLVQTAQQELR